MRSRQNGARRFPRQSQVTIDVQMSETALASDYVLPGAQCWSAWSCPSSSAARNTMWLLRTPIIERIHPETRPCDEIFTALAEGMRRGTVLPFTVEELADAQLASVGTSPRCGA